MPQPMVATPKPTGARRTTQTSARRAGFVSDASTMKAGAALFDLECVIEFMKEVEAARHKSPLTKKLAPEDAIPVAMVCPLITRKHTNLEFEEARDAWVRSVTEDEGSPLFLYCVEPVQSAPSSGNWEYMPFNKMVASFEKGLNPVNVNVLFTIYDLCKPGGEDDAKALEMWAAAQAIRSRLVGDGDVEFEVGDPHVARVAERLGKTPEAVKGVHDRLRTMIRLRIEGTLTTGTPVTHIINKWAHCTEPEEIMAFADLAETSVAEWKVKAALIIRTWGFAALDRYRPDRANYTTRRGFMTPRPSVVFSSSIQDRPHTLSAKFERSKWQWYYLLEVACGSIRSAAAAAESESKSSEKMFFTREDLTTVDDLDTDADARRYLRLDNELEYPSDAFKERGNMQFLLECIMVLVDAARASQTKDITNLAQTPLSEKTISSSSSGARRKIDFGIVVTPPIGAVVVSRILPRAQLHIVADDSWRAYCMCAFMARSIQKPPVLTNGSMAPITDLSALQGALDHSLSSPAAAFIQHGIKAYSEEHGGVGELAVPGTSKEAEPSATYLADLVTATENEVKEAGQVPIHADYKPTDRGLPRQLRGGRGGVAPPIPPQRFDQVPTWFIFKTPLDQLTASKRYNCLFVPAMTKDGQNWRTVNGMESTHASGDSAPRMRLENVSLPHDKVLLLYPFAVLENKAIFAAGSGSPYHLAHAIADQSDAEYASPIPNTDLSIIIEEPELLSLSLSKTTPSPSFHQAHPELLSSSSNILGTRSVHSALTSASHGDHREEGHQSPQRDKLRRGLSFAMSVVSTATAIQHSPVVSRDDSELPYDEQGTTVSASVLEGLLSSYISPVTTTGEDVPPPRTPPRLTSSTPSEFQTPAPAFNGRKPVRIDKEPSACWVVETNVEKAHLMARLIRPMLTALATTAADLAPFLEWWTHVLGTNTKADFMAALETATRSVTSTMYDAFVQSMVHPGLLLSAVSINLRYGIPGLVADLAFANSLVNTQLLVGQYTQFGFLTHVHTSNDMECDMFDSAQFARNVLFTQAVAKARPSQVGEASVAASAFIDAHIAASTRWRVVSRVVIPGNFEMGDVNRRENVSTLEILDGEKARRELVDVDGAQRTVFIKGPKAFLANQFSWEGSGRGVLHVPAVHLTVPEPLLMPSNGGREAWTRAQETVYVPSTCIITPALASNGRGLATPNMAMAFVNALVERGANMELGVAKRALQRSSTVGENPRVLSSPVDGPATPWGGDRTKPVFMNPMARDILQGLFASERLVDVFIRQRASTEPAQSITPFPLLVDAIRDAYTPLEAIAPPFIHPTPERNSVGLSQFGRRLAVNTSINSVVSNIIRHEFDAAAAGTVKDPAVLVAPLLGILASRLDTIFRAVINALMGKHEDQPEDVFLDILNDPDEDIPEDVQISVVAVRRVFVLSLSPTTYARVETKAEPDGESEWVSRRGVRVPFPVPNPFAGWHTDSVPTLEERALSKMNLNPSETESLEFTTRHSSTFIIVDMHVESAGMPDTVIKVPVFRGRSAALRSYVPWGMPVEAAHVMAIVGNRDAFADKEVLFDIQTVKTFEDVRVVTVSREFYDATGDSGTVWTPCPRVKPDSPVRHGTCLADAGSMFIGLTPASTCPFDGDIGAIHRAASSGRTKVYNNALGKDVHRAWAASAMVMGTQGGWVHDPQMNDQVYDTPDATVTAATTAATLVGTQAPHNTTADSMLVCTDVAIGAFAYMAAGGDTAAVSINGKTPTGLCDVWMQHVRSTRGCIAVQANALHAPDEDAASSRISDALKREYLFFGPSEMSSAQKEDDGPGDDDDDDLGEEEETKGDGGPDGDDDLGGEEETKDDGGPEGGPKEEEEGEEKEGDKTLNASFLSDVGAELEKVVSGVPQRSLPVVKSDKDRGASFKESVTTITTRLDRLPGEDEDGFEDGVNDMLEALAPGSVFLATLSRELGIKGDTVSRAQKDVTEDLSLVAEDHVNKRQLEMRIRQAMKASGRWKRGKVSGEAFKVEVDTRRRAQTRKLVKADVMAMRAGAVELMGMRLNAPSFVRFLRRTKDDPVGNNVLRSGADISLEEEQAALVRVHGILVHLEDIIKNSVVRVAPPAAGLVPGSARKRPFWGKKKKKKPVTIATPETTDERRDALLLAIDERLADVKTLGEPLGRGEGQSEKRRALLRVAERLLRVVTKANAIAKKRLQHIVGSNTPRDFEAIVKQIVDHSIANSGTDVPPPTTDAPYEHLVKVRRTSSRLRGTTMGEELKTKQVVAAPAGDGQVRLAVNNPTTKTEIVNDENKRLGVLCRSALAVPEDPKHPAETENARLIRQATDAKTAFEDGGADKVGVEWEWKAARKRFQDRVSTRIQELIKLSDAPTKKEEDVSDSSRPFILDVLLPLESHTMQKLTRVMKAFRATSPEWVSGHMPSSRPEAGAGAEPRLKPLMGQMANGVKAQPVFVTTTEGVWASGHGVPKPGAFKELIESNPGLGVITPLDAGVDNYVSPHGAIRIVGTKNLDEVVQAKAHKDRGYAWKKLNLVAMSPAAFNKDAQCQLAVHEALAAGTTVEVTVTVKSSVGSPVSDPRVYIIHPVQDMELLKNQVKQLLLSGNAPSTPRITMPEMGYLKLQGDGLAAETKEGNPPTMPILPMTKAEDLDDAAKLKVYPPGGTLLFPFATWRPIIEKGSAASLPRFCVFVNGRRATAQKQVANFSNAQRTLPLVNTAVRDATSRRVLVVVAVALPTEETNLDAMHGGGDDNIPYDAFRNLFSFVVDKGLPSE